MPAQEHSPGYSEEENLAEKETQFHVSDDVNDVNGHEYTNVEDEEHEAEDEDEDEEEEKEKEEEGHTDEEEQVPENNVDVANHEQQQEEENRSMSEDDDNNNEEEFVMVRPEDIRKEVQCPICLGILRKTRIVKECLHRFCQECIDKSIRRGNKECPACRTHCSSRRALREDPNYDALIAVLYPDIDQLEEEETAYEEDEKARNQEFQEAIAHTLHRQTQALSKKRKRSKGNYRKRINLKSVDEEDAYCHDGGRGSSSVEEPCTVVKPKCSKRRKGQSSPAGPSGDGGDDEQEQKVHKESGVVAAMSIRSPEMLAWGRGGIRSNTRHGSSGGAIGKQLRNRCSRVAEHIRNLQDNEQEIHVVLVSLDEQNRRSMEHSFLSVKPALSVWHLRQFVALQKSLPLEVVEILAAKDPYTKLSTLKQDQIPISTMFEACEDDLRVLRSEETLAGLKATGNLSRGRLILAYRQKLAASLGNEQV